MGITFGDSVQFGRFKDILRANDLSELQNGIRYDQIRKWTTAGGIGYSAYNELENILPYVFAVSKNVISNVVEKFSLLILPITLSACAIATDSIEAHETIQFSINETMLLDDIIFSDVFYYDVAYYPLYTTHSFKMSIDEKPNSQTLDVIKLYEKT